MAEVTIDALNVRALDDAICGKAEAGEAMNLGDWIRIGSDEKAYQTDASTGAGVSGKIGLVVAASDHYYNSDGSIAAGETITYVGLGDVYLGEDAALDETKAYYLSEEQGQITDVEPSISRLVGYPTSSKVFFVNPNAAEPTS